MKKIKFNTGWNFYMGSGSALQTMEDGNPEETAVTLPHDASILRPRDSKEAGGSGNGFFREENYHYIKEFQLPAEDAGKCVWLEFEGIYQNAFVYINNSFAGKNPYGYGNFYVDATKYVHAGQKNTIKVVVKNAVPSGRWYTGGGIYRDVNIMISEPLHLAPQGVRLATVEEEKDLAVIRAELPVEYHGTQVREAEIKLQLIDAQGKVAAENKMPVTIDEYGEKSYRMMLYVDQPNLWNVEHPYLYQYKVQLTEQGEVLDEESGSFGIRKLQLDVKHGLRVNGKSVKLRGGCIHHDNGIIGAAEFPHAEEMRVRRLKEAGYNAIRSSHYPMSRVLLEACDRLGMYVMDEFSDVWTTTKGEFDYGMVMTEWWEKDVTNMVWKDYNHPCVVMYSIGNEIPECGNKLDIQMGKKIADKIRSLDDTRYVTNSVNFVLSIQDRMGEIMAGMAAENAQEVQKKEEASGAEQQEINSMMTDFAAFMDRIVAGETAGKATEEAFGQVDIAGYNYAACRYESDREKYPDRIIVGSETTPQSLDMNWPLVEKYSNVIGDFSWTAWDYLGEAGIGKITYGEKKEMEFYAPYPYKAAYCGDMNLLGDRRVISYWREIIWGLRKTPYIAVQPPQHHGERKNLTNWTMTDAVNSWNWKGYEGKTVTVEVYADAQEAELYVNGTCVERKKVGEQKKAVTYFETTYEPGVLETIVYTDGKEVGRNKIITAENNLRLEAFNDRTQIPADGSDICYVEISVKDGNGNIDPSANEPVCITIEGAGSILGYGSADPESEENYFDTEARPFEGRLRAAVRGNGEKGKITVSLTSKAYGNAKVEIETV